ncbi:MAG: pesticidal protein Cry7Aa [Candidatus Paceibacterota bacterium]|jgi:predicted GH43/DUF377 family glycosyl hydrolase
MNGRVKVEKLGIILAPTENSFENRSVLNPGCYQEGEFVHLFYRAIDKKMNSSIGYAKLKGPTEVVERWDHPIIERKYNYEKKGCEDPRIVKLGSTFYLTYVAHDGKNAVSCYATSRDLKKFEKKGIITPKMSYDAIGRIFRQEQLKDRYFMFESYYEEYGGKNVLLWEKDVFIFPKKIKNKFALIHRILPDIQIVYFDSFSQLQNKNFWKNYLKNLPKYVVLENKYWFESRNIGGGAPPIETKDGWLLIYHAVEELNKSRIYHAAAALLDKKDPQKEIARLNYPLFSPDLDWEKHGFVQDVVFPTGTAIFGEDLYIYYGSADKFIAVAKVNLHQLLKDLRASRIKN